MKLDHVEQLELGYMPLRDDFERVYTTYTTNYSLSLCVWCFSPCDIQVVTSQEYDNNLEEIISEVMVGADEDDVEKELKLAHVDIYNKGLIEREKRKRYVVLFCN